MNLNELTVSELRDELKKQGLQYSGKKPELIMRLLSEGDFKLDRRLKRHASDGIDSLFLETGKRIKIESMEQEEIMKAFDILAEGGEEIGIDGMLRLCSELGVAPEDPVMVVIAWMCQAKNLGVFSRSEFQTGMARLHFVSFSDLKDKIPSVRGFIENYDNPFWEEIYRFAYNWACEQSQKSLSKESALELWPILLQYTGFPFLNDFVNFLEQSPVRGVTKDTWNQTLGFVKYTLQHGGVIDYCIDSSWPVLIDEFVDYMQGVR